MKLARRQGLRRICCAAISDKLAEIKSLEIRSLCFGCIGARRRGRIFGARDEAAIILAFPCSFLIDRLVVF